MNKISIKVEILFDGDRCVLECPFLHLISNEFLCYCFDNMLGDSLRGKYPHMPSRCQKCLDYEKQNANLRSSEVIENEKNTSSS